LVTLHHSKTVFIVLQLRQKITSATSAIKSVFGQEQTTQQDAVSANSLGDGFMLHIFNSQAPPPPSFFLNSFFLQADKLEQLRERMIKVRELFRDTDSTEFVIVTIPAVICQKIFLNTRYASFF
jgi:arsenite-transporting ATPase